MKHVVRRVVPLLVAGGLVVGALAGQSTAGKSYAASVINKQSPIDHVIIIYMENHTFDSILGRYCHERPARNCDGAISGKKLDGTVLPLRDQGDIVPGLRHSGRAQLAAINSGKMNGWTRVGGCGSAPDPELKASVPYGCYTQMHNTKRTMPNLTLLADKFAISDRTFQLDNIASWGSHLELASATLDGFAEDPGINPTPSTFTTKRGLGWGCDSFKDAYWGLGAAKRLVPACIPDKHGKGPYRPSPVQHVPTIMDRLDTAKQSWKIYHPKHSPWAICPTFYSCLGSNQAKNVVNSQLYFSDAAAGRLPGLSFVIPVGTVSQHNGQSMLVGDNWLGSVVNAAMTGPDWKSTAIFLTYDDCGCFYDHVPPPKDLGLRVPMIVISPYAKAHYTDHKTANVVSMLSFVEHLWGMPPLLEADRVAYDYASSFDFNQEPISPVPMTVSKIPPASLDWMAKNPFDPYDEDNAT